MFRLSALLTMIGHLTLGQTMNNGSLEGPRSTSFCPSGWFPCNEHSTPDTQPGGWNVSLQPSDGQSYISLVTRGMNGDEKDGTKEAINHHFTESLKLETTYTFLMDLAYADNFDDFYYLPDWKPVVLNVYLSKTWCDKSLPIWRSPVIRNTKWKTYSFTFTTPADAQRDSFILEADYKNSLPYNGNILIDNVKIVQGEHASPPEESGDPGELIYSNNCKVGLPNVFTPNEDGLNDKFMVATDTDLQRFNLTIYNRWGEKTFETTNIQSGWDGTGRNGDLSNSGVYFYILKCLCIDQSNVIRNDIVKGTVTLMK
jgi:gliding motility-associated-like protein